MMRFDQKAIAGPSPGPSRGHRFLLKKAIENAKKIPHFFIALSITCMALAFLGHDFLWPRAWPSHGLEHGPRIAPSMAKPQPHSQRVVFGTSTQNPIIIQYAERGVTRSLSLAAPLGPGEFMVKKSAGKTRTKSAPETPAPEPDKGGRPIVHTEDVYDEILRRHCEGETITSICRDAGMPTLGTVSRKAADDPMFGKRLTRAKEQFADAVFDEALEIADATGKERKDPPLLPNGKIDLMAVKADVHRDRLRIDTRMRIAAKANPAKYSDRINVNHSGGISLEGVDDGQLNVKLERRLYELGVFELMDRHKVPAAFREEFLGLFRVVELPTSVPAPRALPGEDPEELEL